MIRSSLAAVVVSAAILGALAIVPASVPGHPHRPVAPASTSIPLAARGPISAALGAESPSFRITDLQARNASQHLAATFGPAGVTLRGAGGQALFALTGYGRTQPVAVGNRVDYVRRGLTETWANGPLGLEQSFELRAPVATGRLTLSLAVSGDLRPALASGGGRVMLTGPTGALAYGGLVATDARGRTLPSSLEATGDRIVIHVDTRTAAYPVTVDPFVQQAELTPPHGVTNNLFGYSIAANANTIVVGQVGDAPPAGAVDVFVKPAAGWAAATAPTATLTDASALDFGSAVAIDAAGDTIVVGADHTGAVFDGSAYVFTRTGTSWTTSSAPAATLTGSDTGNIAFFGETVGISSDGTTAVVGAGGQQIGSNEEQGAAYVFVKPPLGWAGSVHQNAELTATGGVAGQELGTAAAISSNGGTVIAGASDGNQTAHPGAGSVYVFEKPGGSWSSTVHQSAELTASDGDGGDQLGSSVALAGNVLAVGAPYRTPVGGVSKQGAVYVYVEPAGGWISAKQNEELTATSGVTQSLLGGTVALSSDGSTLLAGADSAGASDASGLAYVFKEPAAGWPTSPGTTIAHQAQTLTPSNGGPGDDFGGAVAIAGQEAAVGADLQTVGSNDAEGATYLFGYPTPTISIAAPLGGARYPRGTSAKAAYTCSVTGSAISSCTGTTADGAPLPTSTLGAHSFTVTAMTVDGLIATQTVEYQVVKLPRPVLSDLRQAHKRWRERAGTYFSFRLNEDARLTLLFRPAHGRAVKAATKGALGRNRIAFFGVISAHHKLRPGRYTVTFTASNSGGRSKPHSLRFTILRNG
jgi:trimeric autotransporter adhesin